MSAALASRASRWFYPVALLGPIALLYIAVYFGGLAMIGLTSLGLSPGSQPAVPIYANYRAAIMAPALQGIVWRTVYVGLATVAACLILGFPVARYITSSTGRWRGLVLICVLSPLMVSAIGRIFGWVALFGPGSWVADLMVKLLGSRSTGLLYTETAMVIGLTNLLLPFMVLSVAASRTHLDADLLKAASSLGATPFAAFWEIEFPLSLPGVVSGTLIVFSLAASNFVTAALLGGSGRDVVAYHVYLDILVYFEEKRGAALAVLLLIADVLLMMAAIRVARGLDRTRPRGAAA